MKEFKVYITQNYQPITIAAETQEEAEHEVKVRFIKSGQMWQELQVEELNVLAVGIATHNLYRNQQYEMRRTIGESNLQVENFAQRFSEDIEWSGIEKMYECINNG